MNSSARSVVFTMLAEGLRNMRDWAKEENKIGVFRLLRQMVFAVVVIAILTLSQPYTEARAAVVEGECGTSKWSIDDSGLLTIGSGTLADNSQNQWDYWPWHKYASSVKSVLFEDGVVVSGSLKSMFQDCSNLTYIDLAPLDMSRATNMNSMFYQCSSLTGVGLSGVDTSKVTDFKSLFEGCTSLASIDLGAIDSSSATTMSRMFRNCSSLESISMDGLNTSNCRDMENLFDCCSKLTSIDISDLDMSNVENITGMFANCTSLSQIDLSNKDLSNVVSMGGTFYYCSSLTNIDLTGIETPKVTDFGSTFEGCRSLVELDLGQLDSSNVTTMYRMLHNCNSLKTITTVGFDTSSCKNMDGMFGYCYSLTSIDISGFDTSNVTTTTSMFIGCSSLESIDLSTMDTSNVGYMGTMFSGCSSLRSADLSMLDFSKLINADHMFENCVSLVSFDLSGKSMPSVKNMSSFFRGCTALETVDLSEMDTPKLSDIGDMFRGCSSINDINLMGLDTSCVEVIWGMFNGCTSLVRIDLSALDFSSLKSMADTFSGCTKLKEIELPYAGTPSLEIMENTFQDCASLETIDLSRLNTNKVTDMHRLFRRCYSLASVDMTGLDMSSVWQAGEMFRDCSSLVSLDLSGANMSSLTDMGDMFMGCSSLATLDLSGLETSHAWNMHRLFKDCSSLTRLDLSGFNTSNVTDMAEVFHGCTSLRELDISTWQTQSATDMAWMFAGCESLKTLDLPGFYTANVTSMAGQFNGCKALTVILVGSGWSTSTVKNTGSMFEDCLSLTGGNGTKYAADHVDGEYGRIDAPGVPGYLTRSLALEEEEQNANSIIQRVRAYTTGELMGQWQNILDSSDSREKKLQQGSELFARYGIFDCREGVSYLSNTSTERFSYLGLTTDDIFIAHQFAWWLNNPDEGKAARISLYASDVIFNNRFSASLDFTDLANKETPKVKKYKALLYDFIDNTQADIEVEEILKAIKYFKDSVGKTNSAAKAEADYCIEALKGAMTVEEAEIIVGYLDDRGIYASLDEKDGEKVFSLDKDSGFGKFATVATDFADTIEFGLGSVEMFRDWILFDSKLTSYLYYDGFLSDIAESPDLPDDLRYAAELIRREMEEGDQGQLRVAWLKMAENLDKLAGSNISKLPSSLFKASIKAVFGDVAEASFSSYLAAAKVSAWAVNKLTGVGGVVDDAYLIEGYDLLCTHYRERLEADTTQFLAAQTEENAWQFYEDYSMLWQLRLKGEKAYLKMQKASGVTALLRKHKYERYETNVNEIIEILKSCRFVLGEGIEVPESAQFATKFVIDCPVDVDVYAPDGTLVATLSDGAESDAANEHGRFIVTWRSWTGEWAKIICLSQEGDYRVVARGVDDGTMSMHMAKVGDARTYAVSNVPVSDGSSVAVSVEGMAAGEPCAVDGDGNGSAESEAVVLVTDPDAEPVIATGLSLSREELSLELGETVALVPSVEPANTTEQSVLWISSDDSVVTVAGGRVTATGVGQAEVTCTSLSDNALTALCSVTVKGVGVSNVEVEPIEGLVYSGEALEPLPAVTLNGTKLILGTDYELSYANNTNAGIATLNITGIGGYSGSATATFKISPADISGVAVSAIDDQAWTGSAITPRPQVKDGDKTLAEGTDYELSYANNVDPGTATVTITGKGNYTGTASATFAIVKQAVAWKRLAGNGRYDTMAEIVQEGWAGQTGGTVVVATGEGFKDALAAAGLAGLDEAPVVLTAGKSLSKQAEVQLKALKPSKVYVAGGTFAVSDGVLSSIKKATGVKPTRVFGQTSASTSAALAIAGMGRWGDTAIIATNKSFKDALSVAPVSYAKHWPILLADNGKSINDDVIKALKDCGIKHAYIVGGTAAVTPNVEEQLKRNGVDLADRLAGANGIETSRAIADFALENGLTVANMAFATSLNFPDALGGAALCGKNASVLLLCNEGADGNLSFATERVAGIDTGYVFGGTYAFSERLYDRLLANAS